ncbi:MULTISPECIES: DUF2922 domain-containing protein [Clostridium]|uniref:DUF2922 domain-containing protein n=1 Tax=Clostridium brassicae TaxID=2999072 RepID=A0ABT4D805_9CLOT|nr:MULTISPECIES: DUF2922 domain-containing protein [Clostridium]MCY6958432.1 DUF2922 domain-containing protein [Clostridium brassicae]WMJ81474.1 DUF2922 domain-containing protein [Clostridium sp. MB40-C1]
MKVLVMNFLTKNGSKASIRVGNVKDVLDAEEVSKAMDTIIAKNIFATKNGELERKDAASIVETTVEELEI